MNDLEASLTTTLDDSNNDTFIPPVAMAYTLLFAAHPRFVNLYLSAQFRRIGLGHGITDAVAEIPSGLIRDPNGSLDLIGRDTLFGLQHQVDGDEPLRKWKVAIVEDGSCRYGELVAT